MAKFSKAQHQKAEAAAKAAAEAAKAAGKSEAEQQAAAAAAAAAVTFDPDELVETRVLTACTYGQANDIARIRAADLPFVLEQGLVDDHPDAVAYARLQVKR